MKYTIILLPFLMIGCVEVEPIKCRGNADCHPSQNCVAGDCNQPTQETSRLSATSDDAGTAQENPTSDRPKPTDFEPIPIGMPDAGPEGVDMGAPHSNHPCSEARAPVSGELVINEVLASVPSGDEGDANLDGTRDAYQDEFVEIVNTTDMALDLAGLEIWVGERSKYQFEPLCLMAREAVVVFGGGSPNLAPEINVLTSQTRLSLTNSGGVVSLVTLEGDVLSAVQYGDSPTSWVVWPEVHGGEVRAHADVGERLFSPGTCVDGTPFVDGCG